MPVHCEVIIRWDATPEQLSALGSALWRWCKHTAGNTGIYQYLDNQALDDLIAGKLPVLSQPPLQADAQGVHFRFRDELSQHRQAALDGLRLELPAGCVEDVMVDGASWNSVKSGNQTCLTPDNTPDRAPGDGVPHLVEG